MEIADNRADSPLEKSNDEEEKLACSTLEEHNNTSDDGYDSDPES